MTIGYIDFEFTREPNGLLRPTELGIAWWQNQYLKCQLSNFNPTHKLKDIHKSVKQVISSLYNNNKLDTLVFWGKNNDVKILKQSGVDLSLYNIVDLQDIVGKIALKDTAKYLDINSDTLKQHLLPTQRDEVKKLSPHTGIGDALRIALIHKEVLTKTTTTTTTTTTKTTKTKAKPTSSYYQIFQYLDTVDFSLILVKKRLTHYTTMKLWKDACLQLPHLNISYHNFEAILKAHLLSLL